MKKKKNLKKNKNNKFKGFTLVELLAVIVILAIIMIIAIPAVLETMETAKKKSMVTFAQKAMNEAEKQFLSKQAYGELALSAQNSKFYFDIRHDLDLSNTGDYYGVVTVGVDQADGNYTEIALYTSEYFLNYSSWRNLDKLEIDRIKTSNVIDLIKGYGIDPDKANFKEFSAAKNHCGRCGWHVTSHTDGATNTKLFDNTPSYRSNYTLINGVEVCNDEEGEKKLSDKIMRTYLTDRSKIGDCDYIWNLS